MAEESNSLQHFQEIGLDNNVNGGHFGDFISNEAEKLYFSAESVKINELTLIDVGSVDEEENIWLSPVGSPLAAGITREWLKDELDLTGVTVEKNTLVDMLDDISRKSNSHSRNSYNSPKSPTNSETSERSIMSPPILPSVYLCPQPVYSTPPTSTPMVDKQKISPKIFQGCRIMALETDENSTPNCKNEELPLNSTFNSKETMNSTLNKASSPSTGLNSTYNKDSPLAGRNSTFSKDSPLSGLNSTFSKDDLTHLNSTFSKEGNATFNKTDNMNATFETNNEKDKFDIKATGEVEEISIASSTSAGEAVTNGSMNNEFNGVTEPTFDSSENSKNSGQDSSHESLKSPHGLDSKPDKPVPQISKTRLPPPSRLQAPASFRYQTPSVNTGAPAIGGRMIRSGLRPPASIAPRKTLKSPTSVPITGLRPPSAALVKDLRPPTSVQVKQVRPPTFTLSRVKGLRPPTSIPERGPRPSTSSSASGLKKPSVIVKPGVMARPSGLVRPIGRGIAIPSTARQGKTVNGGRAGPGKTESVSAGRLKTG